MLGAERNHCPAILNMAKITKRPSSSNAALNIRVSCVLASTNRHIKVQSDATSDMRKIKYTILPNINNIITYFNIYGQGKNAYFNI
jgi:hypothetical protein